MKNGQANSPKGLGGSGIRPASRVRSYPDRVSASQERDEIVHDMAGMVQVLDLGLLALDAHPVRLEREQIIAECRTAIARLRADFERFKFLCRVP